MRGEVGKKTSKKEMINPSFLLRHMDHFWHNLGFVQIIHEYFLKIEKKRDGECLDKDEIDTWVEKVVDGEVANVQVLSQNIGFDSWEI